MSVVVTRPRLAALNALIVGIEKSFDIVPRVLNTSDLPAAIIRVREASYDYSRQGSGIVQENRIYRLEFYIAEVQQGAEGEAEEATIPFLDRIREFYSPRIGLELAGNDAIVYEARLQGDSGSIDSAPYPQNSNSYYSAAVWPLLVSELYQIDEGVPFND